MKKITLLFFALCSLALYAQEEGMAVVSFKQDLQDLAARTAPRFDMDSDLCALVKIQVLCEDSITFQGSYILGPAEKHQNEYWVYMAKGAKKVSVSHPRYEVLPVLFAEASSGEIKSLEIGSTYRLVISVPEKEVDTVLVAESFEAKLEEARRLYKDRFEHSDSEYFRKAAGMYDAAMKHTDCPSEMLQPLQEEYDNMRYMRKFTFLHEKANRIASEQAATYGYNSDSTYHYLQLAYKAALKLSQKYPQSKPFKQMASAAQEKLTSHPLGQTTKKVTVIKSRPSAHGMVRLYKSSMALNTISIYACKEAKPKSKSPKKLIGSVRADGSYSVILPDGYDYIIFDGEKTAHLVPAADSEINITL